MPSNRRTFLRQAVAAGAVPATASLLGVAGFGAAQATPPPSDELPDYAPVPPGSLGPPMNESGYHVGRIAGNLYWITNSFYQAMFLTTTDGIVLIDAPPTIGHNLLRATQEVAHARRRPDRVTHLVYSHSHADHIGAAALFGNRIVRVAHTEAKRLLRADRDSNRPLPTVTFEDRYHLHVGGEHVELSYHGPNHSPDNIFIRVPSARTLMVVDIIYPGWVPFTNLAESQDIPGWRAAHDIVLNTAWDTYVGGHLGRLGTRADVRLQKEYVADLTASTVETLNTLDPTPYFEKYGPAGNAWATFRSYRDDAAQRAAAPITSKYLGRLAGADVFTLGNAAAMVNTTRIDAGILGAFGIHA
ncbi:MAG TPA: MBL fold metallo-hydrolase [Actinophytocola sp.]|jgi:glyoxylase-like metal-dependent hydrolase (beta-lactamase superfamily II)|uniref:MBL fold metallo-hydrolase n=1 Tax=Actinophytocola sp. TaxID=1872138 RepID=UPI002DFD2584|nr:MBL fold metallo-hydrolase [Actinophytocola sp.]